MGRKVRTMKIGDIIKHELGPQVATVLEVREDGTGTAQCDGGEPFLFTQTHSWRIIGSAGLLNKYDPEIWKSTSNKYRHVARLPEGLDGIAALREHAPEAYQRIVDRLRREAEDTFRRMYSDRVEGCHAELSPDEWAAFRAAGGESSW
jgi:hypothetical protein